MADTAIFDLTPETVLTAAHEFVTQDTSAATPSQAATFALMGGLEIDTTYNSAADHGNIAATAGKLYLVNTSALTTDDDFTLPVAANVNTGERVGVFITTGDDAQELDLKSGAALDLINGVDHSSTSWSRLFITGECVIFRCVDGSTADWIVEYDGRIPYKCRLYADTDQTGNTAATYTPVDFSATTTIVYEVGDIVDSTADTFVIRRTGKVSVAGQTGPAASIASGKYVGGGFRKGASTDYKIINRMRSSASTTVYYTPFSAVIDVANDDTLQWLFISEETGKGLKGAEFTSFISLTEILP